MCFVFKNIDANVNQKQYKYQMNKNDYSQINDLKNKELECKKNQISKRVFWIDIIKILLNNNKGRTAGPLAPEQSIFL